MPLQIRRGTDAERLGSFTPAEGELIYTTDTKKLYVGDGATVGGVAIDTVGSGGGGASVLGDLTDVDITGAVNGSILKFNGTDWYMGSDNTGSPSDKISLTDLAVQVDPAGSSGLSYNNLTGLFTYIPPDLSTYAQNMNGLSDVSITSPVNGQYLRYNGSEWYSHSFSVFDDATPTLGGNLGIGSNDIIGDGDINITGDITAPQFNGTLIGNVTGDVTGNVTGNVNGELTGNVVGNVTGTLTGGVIGDANGNHTGTFNGDVNGNITGNIYTDLITPTTQQLIVKNTTPNDNMSVKINSNDDRSILKLTRESASDLTGVDGHYGAILFERTDVNGSLVTSGIFGQENFLLFGNSADGDMTTDDKLFVWRDNKFGIGTAFPTEELEVVGDTKVSGFVQFGSLTTLERDALTAANGMVIYNSTDNKFQGYENGAWVNLV